MFGGTWAGNVIAIAVIISGFGALNGWTMICAEMPLAGGALLLGIPVYRAQHRHLTPPPYR
jgi:hypothetical protein